MGHVCIKGDGREEDDFHQLVSIKMSFWREW